MIYLDISVFLDNIDEINRNLDATGALVTTLSRRESFNLRRMNLVCVDISVYCKRKLGLLE